MAKLPVQVCVGGHQHRLVTTLDERTMQRLAAVVDERLQQLGPSQQNHPQALLLVALALAGELEAEKENAAQASARGRRMLQHLLERVDAALESCDEPAEESNASNDAI